jgi:hypothetical protein
MAGNPSARRTAGTSRKHTNFSTIDSTTVVQHAVGTSRYHLHTRAKYVYYARVLSTAVRVRILQLHACHTRTYTAVLQLYEYAYLI